MIADRKPSGSTTVIVTIEQLATRGARPALGRESRFALRGEAIASVDYFLEHEGVLYSQPLSAEPDGSIRVYPEAPGRYRLHAVWRSAQGASGWSEIEYAVDGAAGSVPQQITAEGESLWVPTAWDARVFATHERSVFRDLQQIIRPGATVYDIGANVGLFSARFARWIGPRGWLYAIEPNPICVYFLRANLNRTAAHNFTILPVAISRQRSNCAFTLNYGSSLLGVGGDSVVTGKPGHQIHVEGESLDTLIATFNLRQPDFIKLDVEGAEAGAVAGMMNTLEKHRPGFMIELHGRSAASETLRCLGELGYQYLLSSTTERFRTADALLDSLPDACVQVIGYP
jgi:FkbM family methyltransferase